ncbi:hypothetical protein [Staphylothermus hellenicus]|uniref:Uncharacterized protein n=1 Tax=Staphylothermus hellenicus (strain DSM 12710 / JCM 10830 / BK20S6-10-b1 / P8) TaxID=591019 RepID=D7D981_STAHD|nr:hypothetical protein [Staphylothermus hellenicus]ADI32327.1 hypothetical protein Shell_1228 [Staphylothermus hellenicus DSM 12710]
MAEEAPKYVVRVGDKEIEINEETLEIIREYLHRPMSLDELADKLDLESWEEAYEFIKKIPAWIIWTPPALWRYRTEWISRRKQ